MSEENNTNKTNPKKEQKEPTNKTAPKTTVSKPKSSPKKTTPKPKNITMPRIKKDAKQNNSTETYEFNDTDKVTFYPIFPQRKINELMEELRSDFLYAAKHEIELEDEKIQIPYILFLCIKHFTHLKSSISDNLEEKIVQMESFMDTDFFKEIINDVFDPKELNKVFDSLGDVLGQGKFIERIESKAQQSLQDLEIKNKDMFNVLSNEAREKTKVKH